MSLEILGASIALVGLLLSLWKYLQSTQQRRDERRRESKDLLDEAATLLDGAVPDPRAALDKATTALELSPGLSRARFLAGIAEISLGNHSSAILWLQRAQSAGYDEHECWCAIARCRFRQGDFAKSLRAIDRALAAKQTCPQAHATKAAALSSLGRAEDALAAVGEGLSKLPADETLMEIRGAFLAEQERWDEAEEVLRAAVRKNPESSSPLSRLAQVLATRGSVDEARVAFERALRLDPRSPDIHTNLGALLNNAFDNPAEAREHFLAALEQDRSHAQALSNLAIVDARLENRATARDRIAELNLVDPDGHQSAFHAAQSAAARGDHATALAEFERELERDPRSAQALSNLATLVHNIQGEPERALALIDRALEISPAEAGMHYNRGIILETLGRVDEAETAYRRSLEREPGHKESLEQLGAILLRSGRRTEGSALLERARQCRPGGLQPRQEHTAESLNGSVWIFEEEPPPDDEAGA